MNKFLNETLKYALRSNLMIFPFVKKVEKLFKLTEAELYQVNNERFLKIFKKAATRSDFYNKFYKSHGITTKDIHSLEDITKLPVIDKNMIHDNPDRLLTVPKFFTWESHTAGSTGTPLTVYWDYFSSLREQAYFYVYRRRRGFKYGNRLVSLRGHLNRALRELKIGLSNTLYLSSYQINEQTIEYYYQRILAYKPVAIEGYPSSLYGLCCFMKDKNLHLSIPVCFTSSETLFDFQRKLIEDVLNTKIYDNYGNTERTIFLAECIDHRGYFSQPGYSINEFRDDCVITTSLINSSFPLIRYKVNDVISLAASPKLIDSELRIVDFINGRTEDNIIAKDGSRIGNLYHLFKELKNVKLAQILQHARGIITINIVPNGILPEEEKAKLVAKIDERIGLDNIDFTIAIIDSSQIIYTERNKFRQIVSTIH